MDSFKAWLDRWVEQERARDTAQADGDQRDRSGCPGLFPDDRSDTVATTESSEAPVPTRRQVVRGGTDGGFAGFWLPTRRRPELGGLSLASVHALAGTRERSFSGYLKIRDDLPAADYLAVPFVRRAWRLLWAIDDGGGVQVSGGYISFDWKIVRVLGLDPRVAQVNLRLMIQVLVSCGFLTSEDHHGLSSRSRELIRAGRVAGFYKALVVRLLNRGEWRFLDALPPLGLVQHLSLVLLYAVVHASQPPGLTARELARMVATYAAVTEAPRSPEWWLDSEELVAQVIADRFLGRVGRMLGLVERVGASERVSIAGVGRFGTAGTTVAEHAVAGPSAAGPSAADLRYGASPLCRRVLRWQF